VGSNLCHARVINGGVMHGLGFKFLSFGGQRWCSAWSWVRIFHFEGVNVGVVHVVGSNLCLFGGHPWWCSAWSWVPILDFLGSVVA
jgi:hypothetical protein